MSAFFRDYHEAYDYAVTRVRATGQPHGIEAATEYGHKGSRVAMIARDPARRFGWEMRAEPVEIGAPRCARVSR